MANVIKPTLKNSPMPSPNVISGIDTKTRVPQLNIKNFDTLKKASMLIVKQAKHLVETTSNNKDIRKRRTKINKLKRSINNLKKYYSSGSKPLYSQSNELRKILTEGTDILNQPLKQAQKQKKEDLKHRLQSVMHTYCQNAGIPDQEVPDDALKLSMSKLKREKLLHLATQQGIQKVKNFLYWKQLHVAKIKNGKAIDPRTNNVLGVAEHHYIMGKPKAVKQVKQLAQKLHVYIS